MAKVISTKLKPYLITLDLQAKTHEEAVYEIASTLKGDPLVTDFDGFYAALQAREKLESTCLGKGIAFPHARTDAVKGMVIAVGCSEAGVLHARADNQLENLIFVIGTPKRMVTEYLSAVGALARLLKDDALRNKLLHAKNGDEFLFYLAEAEDKL
ncbi:MAG: PTS sugar transporter subunit IIA [Verrucomicrobiales bacterium]|jgi:mannitol/fructose-specific phosphotransferase system IIA component (Ntr-type)|nr:PTS sugar transporter subunit IIA [Verrucomicrobiales bacterium]